MYNFNKFLDEQEELVLNIKSAGSKLSIFFTLLLLLVAFFLLFPMWRAGRQGLWLWLVIVFILMAILAKQLLDQNNRYLLTNKRLIYLRAINSREYKAKGSVRTGKIKKVIKQGRSNIILKIQGQKFYLTNVEERDKVFEELSTYIKRQNLL